MRRAIDLASGTALVELAGGPFSAVVVQDGEVVGEGVNRVIAERDPTWHGEVSAIRDACRTLGTHDLTGAVMYTTGECCPMCYAAACWARIDHIYYASTYADAREYGDFDDDTIDHALTLPYAERSVPLYPLLRDEMVEVWKKFQVLPGRARY